MKIILPTLPEPAPRLTSPQPARIVPFGSPPPDAADEDFADGSVEMNGDGSQLRVALALQAAQPLTSDRTVYVNSATGNDANLGTQAAPFQTFARAWAERQKYGVLRAKFTIQLLGVGPYTPATRLGASLADVGGYLIIRGDEAAEVTHYTGTFSGDFVGNTINTSAGLGTDTHKNRFVKITSGPASGCVFLVLSNTDTSITACSKRFATAGSYTITAGTTFKVFTPGTQFNASPRVEFWRGGEALPVSLDHRHVFFNLAVVGTSGTNGAIGALDSAVALIQCIFTSQTIWYLSSVTTFWADGSILGSANVHAQKAAGLVCGRPSLVQSYASAILSCTDPSGSVSIGVNSVLDHMGGRLAGPLLGTGGSYRWSGAAANEMAFRFEKTLTCQGGTWLWAGNASLLEWAVTSGSCLRVQIGGIVQWGASGVAPSGGTADPAGFGIDVTGGGVVYMRGIAPTLTGGTASKDLKTSNNGGVANSVLSAAGTAAGVAADALLGEVLCRVA